MNRAEEFTFVWALLEAAGAVVDDAARVRLCVRIGAGEYRESIIELLQRFTASDLAIPPGLSASLWSWVNGFVGSDAETTLRHLAAGTRIAATNSTPGAAVHPAPAPLGPSPSGRATCRLATAK